MWIFFDGGMVSCVCARKDGGKSAELDPTMLQVRARSRAHLQRLIDRFPDNLGNCQIVESPTSDYRYRCLVSKIAFADVAAKLVNEIEYGNFKSRVRQVCGPDAYEHALHRVWGDMLSVQHAEQRQDDQADDQRQDVWPRSKRSRRKKSDELFGIDDEPKDGEQ